MERITDHQFDNRRRKESGQLTMTMNNREKILVEYFREIADAVVTSKTLLLKEKVIDSMGVLELIAFIETSFAIELTDDDLTVNNFQSIEAILALIVRREQDMSA